MQNKKRNRVCVDESKQDYNFCCVFGFALSFVTFFFELKIGLVGIIAAIVSLIGILQYRKKHERGLVFGAVGLVIGIGSFIRCMIYLNK